MSAQVWRCDKCGREIKQPKALAVYCPCERLTPKGKQRLMRLVKK